MRERHPTTAPRLCGPFASTASHALANPRAMVERKPLATAASTERPKASVRWCEAVRASRQAEGQ